MQINQFLFSKWLIFTKYLRDFWFIWSIFNYTSTKNTTKCSCFFFSLTLTRKFNKQQQQQKISTINRRKKKWRRKKLAQNSIDWLSPVVDFFSSQINKSLSLTKYTKLFPLRCIFFIPPTTTSIFSLHFLSFIPIVLRF